MMPEKLYGSSNKEVIAVTDKPNGAIFYQKFGLLVQIKADVEYKEDANGDVFVERLMHENKPYYYIIHSEEVMNIRKEENPELTHSRYTKV